MCLRLFLLIIILFQAPRVTAQSNSIIRLVVTEVGGQPLVGANVLLYEEDATDYAAYGVTSRDGFIEFRNLQEGRYLIRVTFIGFQTSETYFNVGRGQIIVERIRLQEITETLMEVEVIGEDIFRTGEAGVIRIRGQDLSRVPSASIEGDLMAYLQTMPGVITTGDQGGELYIRGGTPAQNLVLVDGIPVVKPFHISNLFSAFPERAVNNVTVMAGGFDNRYMGSTSAVVDVNLRTANLNSTSVSGSFSPYLSTLFVETPLKQNTSSLFISGRHSTIKQFSGHLGTRKQDIEFHDVIARYTLQADEFMCSVSALITGDKGKINPGRNLDLSWSNTGAGLRCFGFDPAFNYPFEVSMGYSEFVNSERTDLAAERFASLKQGYLRLGLQAELMKMKVDYGVNILFQGYKAEFEERFATYEEGFDRKISVIQLFAKSKWEVSPWFAMEPGVGTQVTTQYGLTFEPRLRVRYNPFKNNRSELSFAAGYYSQVMDGITDPRDAGSTFTIYNPIRDGDPMPGSLHTIMGLRNRLGSDWVMNIEAYHKWHRNLPVPRWSQVAATEIETALANGEAYGIDLRLEYRSQPWYWYTGYGFGKVQYTAAGDDLGSWISGTVLRFNPSHDQRHKFNTNITYTFSGFTASAGWEFGSGLPYTQIFATDLVLNIPYENAVHNSGVAYAYYARPYSGRLPVYHRLDVSFKRYFNVRPGFRIGTEIGAINLYNRENIFYLDVVSYQVVTQTGLLPYISISATL
jgi:hypothetical protein